MEPQGMFYMLWLIATELLIPSVLVAAGLVIALQHGPGLPWGLLYGLGIAVAADFLWVPLFALYRRRRGDAGPSALPPLAVLDADGAQDMHQELCALGETGAAIGAPEVMTQWFKNAGGMGPSPKYGDMVELTVFGHYYRTVDELRAEPDGEQRLQHIHEELAELQEQWGHQFPKGKTPGVSIKAYIHDPCWGTWLPLWLYVVSEVAQMWSCVVMLFLGYRRVAPWTWAVTGTPPGKTQHTPNPVCANQGPLGTQVTSSSHDERVPLANASVGGSPAGSDTQPTLTMAGSGSHSPRNTPLKPPAIVFLHGIGIGLAQNMLVLRRLRARYPASDIVVREMPHVSLRFPRWRDASPPWAHDVADDVVRDLRALGHASAVFVAHSYGTFVAAAARKQHPAAVAGMVLLDPVCCLLNLPRAVSGFLYEGPRWNMGMRAFVKDTVVTAFARDPIVRFSIQRRFMWHRCALWPNEVPPGSVMWVGATDPLIPANHIARHFRNARVLEQRCSHADVLSNPEFVDRILDAMGPLMAQAPEAAPRRGGSERDAGESARGLGLRGNGRRRRAGNAVRRSVA
ncbi:unnamed protein product [Pedinophyceae sp. YPF-701]|nr:unnamed protein product [Pedinophyceae sp. YPF-701]